MENFLFQIFARLNYWVYILLMMIGLYGTMVKKNYVKKIIGMNILQTAVILFFISMGAKREATIPIISHAAGHAAEAVIRASDYINPLPHVLMLTAIVVAVATLGVALSMVILIFQRYGTLDEEEILSQISEEDGV